jgi:plasmid stabilization system protein ParE
MVIVWSLYAEQKLDKIYNYYVERSPPAANRMIVSIIQAANSLARFPRKAPLALVCNNREYRALLVPKAHRKIHKLIYYVIDDEVRIASVWDCRQNPQRLIDELKNII